MEFINFSLCHSHCCNVSNGCRIHRRRSTDPILTMSQILTCNCKVPNPRLANSHTLYVVSFQLHFRVKVGWQLDPIMKIHIKLFFYWRLRRVYWNGGFKNTVELWTAAHQYRRRMNQRRIIIIDVVYHEHVAVRHYWCTAWSSRSIPIKHRKLLTFSAWPAGGVPSDGYVCVLCFSPHMVCCDHRSVTSVTRKLRLNPTRTVSSYYKIGIIIII